MRRTQRGRIAGLTIAALTLSCMYLSAQDSTQNESVSAAERARTQQIQGQSASLAAQVPVARLSHLAGDVTVVGEGGTDMPAAAALNMPIAAGTRLQAGANGEAEVEFPDGSVLRLTPGSTATLGQIEAAAQSTQLALDNGLFYLELRAGSAGSYTVSAGELLLSPEQNASFRVRVREAQVETAVLSGTVSVTRANAYTAEVEVGESVRTDPKNSRRYLLAQTISPEPWDDWNEKLAQAALDEQAARTTARDGYAGDQGYGWADLDAGGRWYSVPGEGEVWQPTVADASFDPYGNGNWIYGPGGYTWASGYSWGWLPYRCGAWSYYDGFGWGWVPSSGCLTFGFGGGVDSGFVPGSGGHWRVRRPPVGWRPPRFPVAPLPGTGHPTLPVRLRPVEVSPGLPPRTSGVPIRIAGATVTPLPRVGKRMTPQGGSAVGSSLSRDFPIRGETGQPMLGAIAPGPVALPGRPAPWQRVERSNDPAQGLAAERDGRSEHAGSGRKLTPGSGYVGSSGRLPKPTDAPVGAAGSPPLNANGAPPVNATGAAPRSAQGSPPLGANGAPPFGATGLREGSGASAGETILRRGGNSGNGTPSHPTSPSQPGSGVSPVQGGLVPRSAPTVPVIQHLPMIPVAPRIAPAPSAPHVAPTPAVSAPAASAKPK